MLHPIADPAKIQEVMRAYVLDLPNQKPEFIAAIYVKGGELWNGHTIGRGGLCIEGARPFSIVTEANGEITYQLTNSDSNYTRAIGKVQLSGIKSLELLR